MLVNRRIFDSLIHARQDVAEVSISEILHVGARKGLARAVAAARVRVQNKIAGSGEGVGITPGARPVRCNAGSRAAMHREHQGVALRRVEVTRIHQPALDHPDVGCPVEALRLAPDREKPRVAMRDLFPLAERAGPYFRRLGVGLAHDGGGPAVTREREAEVESAGRNCFGSRPQSLDLTASRVYAA